MAKPAVLIIGWDGATPALLKMWGQRGKLPTIARLMDQGWWGKLRSVIQPGSAQAWTSIVTGCNPGKHGLLGFSRWNRANYTWQLNDSRTRAVPALWQLLSEHGLRSAVLFVPMTYPPDSFNGVMIAGLGIPSLASVRTFPNDFRQELLQKWSPSEIREPGPRGVDSSSFLEAQLKSIDAQAEIVKDLLAKNEFDMCMIVFGQSDRIQHFYWGQTQDNTDGNAANPDDNAVFRVYQRLDAALGRILSSIDLEHTTVIVLSDHGAGPYETIFYLNNWLNEQGWLAYGDSGFSTKSLPKNLLKATGRWVRRLGLASVVRNGLALMPHKFSKQLGNSVVKLRAETPSIDWRRTKVYSIDYYGNIYLNLEGREPLGCVRQGEQARELLEEITSALYEVRHPETNALVIERVYTPDELYTGPSHGTSAESNPPGRWLQVSYQVSSLTCISQSIWASWTL